MHIKRMKNVPDKLFEIYDEQRKGLMVLREKYGPIITPDRLEIG